VLLNFRCLAFPPYAAARQDVVLWNIEPTDAPV
jgi:hypothetical protein